MAGDQWTIRNLLTPLTTRLLIGGVNPFDLEEALTSMEAVVIRNTGQLEELWLSFWNTKAEFYAAMAAAARGEGVSITVEALLQQTAACRFAAFLINPASIEKKKAAYSGYRDAYAASVTFPHVPVTAVDVPLDNQHALAAYLHLPPPGTPLRGSIVFFSGLGSCKEEMHMLARPLAERGVAVLVPDMPGCGASLFERGVQCRVELLEASFAACLHVLKEHSATGELPVGCGGLCMGGGYAYRAAARNSEYRYCAVLFPLFVKDVTAARTPQWMMAGEWVSFQTGYNDPGEFEALMGCSDDEFPSCPFFIAHGRNDNWMGIERARELCNRVAHTDREMIVVGNEDAPATQSSVLHTMPVGEQLHWVKHLFADWVSRHAGGAV